MLSRCVFPLAFRPQANFDDQGEYIPTGKLREEEI